MFASIFITVLPVFGIILIGFLSERQRFMPAEMAGCLNQFVYWIALPALLFHELSAMRVSSAWAGYTFGLSLAALLAMLLTMLLLHVWPCRTPWRKAGMGALFAAFPNSAFVGLPIVALLYPGDEAVMLSASLATAVYTLVLVVGDVGLEIGQGRHENGWGAFCRETGVKLMRNPLLVSTAAGLVCGLLELPMPTPVRVLTNMLKATASPCALFCMGMLLAGQMDLVRQRTLNRERTPKLPHVYIHVMRLVGHPLLVWLVLRQTGSEGLVLGASVLLASMPTGLASYVVAEKQHVFAEQAPLVIMISTALSVLSVPAVASVLKIFQLA